MNINHNEDDFSDTGSTFSADLSPTDGYFSRRELPLHRDVDANTNTSAQSAMQGDVSAKVQGANYGLQSVRDYNAPRIVNNGGARRFDAVNATETTPLLHPVSAPPAYADVISNTTYTRIENQSVGRLPTQWPFLNHSGQAQSMIGNTAAMDDEDDIYNAPPRRPSRYRRILQQRRIVKIVGAIGFVVVLLFVANIIMQAGKVRS